MNRDLVNDRYGRFYEIPAYLSELGHRVQVVCHNYRQGDEICISEQQGLSLLSWNLGREPISGFRQHYLRLGQLIVESEPDVIIAASDCYQIIIGSELSGHYNIPLIVDLYDNFEAYSASRVPGILSWFYRALARAQAITVVSDSLLTWLSGKTGDLPPVCVIQNAVAKMFFTNRNQDLEREYFGFASDAIYLGTAGNLGNQRGVKSLVKAFLELVSADSRLHLVLAGQPSKNLASVRHPNLHLLGQLNHADIPRLFTALDIGIISLRDDVFGRYCFPQKFYEMIACGLPLVATEVGEMKTLLSGYPRLLYRAEDAEDLKQAIQFQKEYRIILPVSVPTWQDQAQKFERIAYQVTGRHE